MMWELILRSEGILTAKDRDFVVDFVSSEAGDVIDELQFVLHEVTESERQSAMLIEGTRAALDNLVEVIADNTPFAANYSPIR